MAFGSLSESSVDGDLAEINMIPLIDVMLVLLIIFIVAAPMMTHAVKVDLPKASSILNVSPPNKVDVSIDGENQLWWDGTAIEAAELETRLNAAARQTPPPELHLRAARTTPYEKITDVMTAAARHGIGRIGFVTDPAPAP